MLSTLLVGGVVAALLWPTVGHSLFGLALLGLVGWLARHDVARRTVRSTGLTRFMAASMLAGYAWLAVAAVTWTLTGPAYDGPAYDVVVHAVFLGFTMSMIMAHAPVILPAVLRRPLPYHPAMLVPAALLHVSLTLRLWVGDGYMAAKQPTTFAQSGEKIKADFYARQEVKSREEFFAWLDWAKAHGALGTGPSATLTARGDQSYMDLVQPWMNQAAHERGLFVHAYTVDEAVDFDTLTKAGVDGFFTNRTDQLLMFLGRSPSQSVTDVLKAVGY